MEAIRVEETRVTITTKAKAITIRIITTLAMETCMEMTTRASRGQCPCFQETTYQKVSIKISKQAT